MGRNTLSCSSFCFCALIRPSRNSFCFSVKLAALLGVISARAGARDGLCAEAVAVAVKDLERTAIVS